MGFFLIIYTYRRNVLEIYSLITSNPFTFNKK